MMNLTQFSMTEHLDWDCGDMSPLSSARHVAQFQSTDMSAHSKDTFDGSTVLRARGTGLSLENAVPKAGRSVLNARLQSEAPR